MKNQYFGDVNDYLKYGLLRALLSDEVLKLLIAWMLTPDDGGSDGRLRSYLQEPNEWKHFDPELYSGLAALLPPVTRPHVELLESSGLLRHSAFFTQLVPDKRTQRHTWFTSLLEASSGADLVFLDPDNGIEVPSKPVGRKDSSKHVLWSELQQLWCAGSSLLIYQHFPRQPRDPFCVRVRAELQHCVDAPLIEGFRTGRVLFLLAGQTRHRGILQAATSRIATHWHGKIETIGWSAA